LKIKEKNMNKIKIKVLTLGIVSGLILSSVPVLAEDNTSKLINNNTTIQYENVDKDTRTTETSLNSTQSNVKLMASGYDSSYIQSITFTSINQPWATLIVEFTYGNYMVEVNNTYVGYNNITSGKQVSALQGLLWKLGYNISIDNYFGPQTRAAVIDFQKKHGLAVDGITGPNTWHTMIAATPGVIYL
jgi:murein L,D-transpeptidase YcbB/YkuD